MNTHPALYLNNYRGFHNTYLELKSVSFLIGENSSGKTSLLKLIKLLSSHQFWFSYDFNCEKLDLGYFSEIASKHKSEDYFEIGLTHKQPQFAESNSNTMNFIKMRFVEQNGIPKLESVRMKFESFDAKLVYGKKVQKIYYNSITAEKKQKSITNADFKKWAFSNLENESFENSFEINEMGQFPMSFISDFIAEDFSKKIKF